MGNTKLCSVSSPDSYQNQAFLSAYLIVYQVLGDLHHLLAKKGQLTFYSLFSDKDLSEDLFVLIFPKSGATLRKH